jgi:DNA-binding transcriptional MerR regulator
MHMRIFFGIGDLAKDSGVKVATIRYYEKIGLMPALLCDLGFTLDQARELLAPAFEESTPCAEVKRTAIEHRGAVGNSNA